MSRSIEPALACRAPQPPGDVVQLAHGGGGKLTARLIERVFVPAFRNAYLEELGDGAVVPFESARLAFTTDSFVVKPIFFPGGDIGSLAVHGTLNDLAMCGSEPMFLSAGLILEEGFPLSDLERIVASMARASAREGVPLVTGDTKVVDRGKGDGVFVNTSGVGRVRDGVQVGPSRAAPGDAVLVSGPLGEHGIAVMAAREGIELETTLVSDSACVVPLVRALLNEVPATHVLRDPTRGGLASALAEIAVASEVGIQIEEAAVPVRDEVRGACELLGLDPLYVACEGRFLAVLPGELAGPALAALRSRPEGRQACRIGSVRAEDAGRLVLRTALGSHRLLERLSGEQLPEDLLMHEYSIVRALLDRVEREAQARGSSAVHKLGLKIGALAGVEPELLASAFALCRDGTVCAAAQLEIGAVPASWECGECGRPIRQGAALSCPVCAMPARLTGGDEIVLERIEMEVP